MLQPVEYLNKLPKSIAADERVLVADPMMATGGSMVHVLKDLVKRGASAHLIRVVCMTCAPPALERLEQFTGTRHSSVDTLIIQTPLVGWMD